MYAGCAQVTWNGRGVSAPVASDWSERFRVVRHLSPRSFSPPVIHCLQTGFAIVSVAVATMDCEPHWDGLVLRGSISPWRDSYSVFTQPDWPDVFGTTEWRVDLPWSSRIALFTRFRVRHEPSPEIQPDLSLTFTIMAPSWVPNLPDLTIGPLEGFSKATEIYFEVESTTMKAHFEAGSTFEMRVTCPSWGLFPSSALVGNPRVVKPTALASLKPLIEFAIGKRDGGCFSNGGSSETRCVVGGVLCPIPFDVRFSFPRSGQDLWASSTILSDASAYYKTLLESGFAESQVETGAYLGSTTTQTIERSTEWSDSDDDDTSPVTYKSKQQIRTIVIKDHSFNTYHAVRIWILTKQITFASLRPHPTASAVAVTAPATSSLSDGRHNTDTSAAWSASAPIVSPKSVYRLAHLLELDDLKRLALDAFKACLTVQNVAHQLSPRLLTRTTTSVRRQRNTSSTTGRRSRGRRG